MKLTTLEYRLGLAYAGVTAVEAADAENVTVDAVRRARWRCGRRPDDGLPPTAARRHPEPNDQGEDLGQMMRRNRSTGL